MVTVLAMLQRMQTTWLDQQLCWHSLASTGLKASEQASSAEDMAITLAA